MTEATRAVLQKHALKVVMQVGRIKLLDRFRVRPIKRTCPN